MTRYPENDNSALADIAGAPQGDPPEARALTCAAVAASIIAIWTAKRVATVAEVSVMMTLTDPPRVAENWDRALLAAKLIAHSSGLRIPPGQASMMPVRHSDIFTGESIPLPDDPPA